jgi:hypothetical protein
MDFVNRETQQPTNQPAQAPAPGGRKKSTRGSLKSLNFTKIITVVLLFSATILVIAMLVSLFTAKSREQKQYVDSSKMQAVFLNGGQVYFGNITDLNKDFVKLNNIYYLRVNQQVQPGSTQTTNDISLVKLGCELHGPQDQMVINSDQVIFWENLKDDGQVGKAVAEYVKANPNGQNCAQANQTTDSNSNKSEDSNN